MFLETGSSVYKAGRIIIAGLSKDFLCGCRNVDFYFGAFI